MGDNKVFSLCVDLENRLEDLCCIHDHSTLYVSEYFFELRNRIDIDTEEHLQTLIGNRVGTEVSRVKTNNMRSDFIRLIKVIEDNLLRKISASTAVSSQSEYDTLRRKVDQFKVDFLQDGAVDVNSVKYAYSFLALEILEEKNKLEKRLFCNQTIIYMEADKLDNKLGYLIYLTDDCLSKEEIDCVK